MFQPIGKVIEKRIKEHGLKNKLLVVELSEVFTKVIDEVLDKNSSGFARAVSFKNGILIVKTKNLAVRQKISSEKTKIINSLNKTIGEKIVKKVAFRA
jgi:hypothetical protein